MERKILAYNVENAAVMLDVLCDINNETNHISFCGRDEKGRLLPDIQFTNGVTMANASYRLFIAYSYYMSAFWAVERRGIGIEDVVTNEETYQRIQAQAYTIYAECHPQDVKTNKALPKIPYQIKRKYNLFKCVHIDDEDFLRRIDQAVAFREKESKDETIKTLREDLEAAKRRIDTLEHCLSDIRDKVEVSTLSNAGLSIVTDALSCATNLINTEMETLIDDNLRAEYDDTLEKLDIAMKVIGEKSE